MTYLQDETDNYSITTPSRVWAGIIATDANNVSDRISVIIPGLDGGEMRWENCRWPTRSDALYPTRGDECLLALDDNNEFWIVEWWPDNSIPGSGDIGEQSFLRAFGPDTSSTIPANAWTAIVLDPAGEPWRQFGDVCWEWIAPGDPDYSLSPAGIRCLKEGIYDFAGSVVFNAAQGTGTRGVRVYQVKGPYAGQWQLTISMPMPKGNLNPIIVAGESYQYVGNIIELQAWSDTATSTMNNPQSEWLSACKIGIGPPGPPGPKGDVGGNVDGGLPDSDYTSILPVDGGPI